MEVSQPINVIPFERSKGARHWSPESLDGLMQGLLGVEDVTEESFLALGHKISTLHGDAQNISTLAENVVGIINGDGGESTLQHLQLLVERYSLWLKATSDKSAETCLLLQGLHAQLNDLGLPFQGLKKVIKTLHSLRVSTRIEASKGYAAGAAVLAKSLDELGSMIQGKVLEIYDLAEELVLVIKRSIEMEEIAQSGTVRTANAAVEQARKQLGHFLENCLETSHWTDRLKEQSTGVSESFAEIVSALQFQDITRQRLEHVRNAVDSLGQHLEKFKSRQDYSNDSQAEKLFGCICKLQHDQLEYAVDEFVAAAGRLAENLQSMSINVTAMAGDTRELSRVSNDSDENRYSMVQDSLKSISGHLERTGEAHSRTVANLADVASRVSKVSVLVGEVEFVGEEMQLLAINAAISAAHARQKGAGLDIIAQNIQEVAEEACAHAMALSDQCVQIADDSARLKDIEENSQGGSDDVGRLLEEASGRLTSFDASHARLASLAAQVDSDAGALADEVSTIVADLQIIKTFMEKITPVLDQFRGLSHGADASLSKSDSADLGALFDELELCYTMASERQVHKGFVGSQHEVNEEENGSVDEWAVKRDHGLGDNVDLF